LSYQFSAADREIQLRARQFVDEELIPWEVHAEMNQGEIPDDVQARHEKLVRELGFLRSTSRSSSADRDTPHASRC